MYTAMLTKFYPYKKRVLQAQSNYRKIRNREEGTPPPENASTAEDAGGGSLTSTAPPMLRMPPRSGDQTLAEEAPNQTRCNHR
jgi:hypothetical protein